MKLAKSLLLGSAAALATAAGAQAADLPVRKAAPVAVEYVRVCSTYGAGFFVIPGTDSCIKLGGRIRAEALIQERFNRGQDAFGFRARGRMQMDVRTPTPYGLLRTFVRFQITADSGSPYNGGATQLGGPVQKPILDQGYIQFGGLTAGRVTSFFSNGDLPTGHWGTLRFDDAPDITTFAYTFSLGNGFSISAAVEDPQARRVNGAGGIVRAVAPEGFEWPDVVGNIKYAGTWGTAQISGAVHQITDAGVANVAAVPGTTVVVGFDPITGAPIFGTIGGSPAVVGRRAAGDEIGFAVAGYLGVNLPMIAAGDAAWLAATYADGAVQYVSGGNVFGSTGANSGFVGNGPGFQSAGNNIGLPVTDGFINARGNIETTEAFSVAGGFRHFWVPSVLRSNVFGSYLNFDFGNAASARRAAPLARSFAGYVDFDEFKVGGNLIWSPVSGLDIGVEVLYTNVQSDRPIIVGRGVVGATPARVRISSEEDTLEGRLRVQRDF